MSDIYLYSVDAGAFSVMLPVWKYAKTINTKVKWIAEGYSARCLKNAKIRYYDDINKVIAGCGSADSIVFGSQMNFLKTQKFIEKANQKGIETYFLFDHWCEYVSHFSNKSGLILPSKYIFVIDKIEKKILTQNKIPKEKIIIAGHPAIERTIGLYKKWNKREIKKQILFLSEPLEKDYKYDSKGKPKLGFTEKDILRQFLACIESNSEISRKYRVLIKTHPREDVKIVKGITRRYNKIRKIEVISAADPIKLIFESEIVFGITTILLLHALAIGKKTASIQINPTRYGRENSNCHIDAIVLNKCKDILKLIKSKRTQLRFKINKNSSKTILKFVHA